MRSRSAVLSLVVALAALPYRAAQRSDQEHQVEEPDQHGEPTEQPEHSGVRVATSDQQHQSEQPEQHSEPSDDSSSPAEMRPHSFIPSHSTQVDNSEGHAPSAPDGHQHIGEDTDTVVDFADHASMTRVLFALMICLSLGLVLSHYLHHAHIAWLPESTFFILLGIGLGWGLRAVFGRRNLTAYFGTINAAVLNFLLLPPIIFESGWSLRWKDFVVQFDYILIFALAGTVIATLTTAYMIQWTGVIEEWHTIFTFASLISAVDPVATLATYSALKVEPLLNIMVFGESVINDAVAIALFKAGNEVSSGGAQLSAYSAFSSVVRLLFGSITLGLLLGGAVHMVLMRMRMNDAEVGVSTIGLTAYLAYTMAESVHLSGIIATLFCGICMGALLHPTMTTEMARVADMTLMRSAMRADIVIFMFVGAAICLVEEWRGVIFGLQVSGFCLISRALAVFPLGLLSNLLKMTTGRKRNFLSTSHLFMMWHAGLRGGIAMALVLEIESDDPVEKGKLQEATFIVIVVFLLVFGGSTKYFLQLLKIPIGDNSHEDVLNIKSVPKTVVTKRMTTINLQREELAASWNDDDALAEHMLASPRYAVPRLQLPTLSPNFVAQLPEVEASERNPGKPIVEAAGQPPAMQPPQSPRSPRKEKPVSPRISAHEDDSGTDPTPPASGRRARPPPPVPGSFTQEDLRRSRAPPPVPGPFVQEDARRTRTPSSYIREAREAREAREFQ